VGAVVVGRKTSIVVRCGSSSGVDDTDVAGAVTTTGVTTVDAADGDRTEGTRRAVGNEAVVAVESVFFVLVHDGAEDGNGGTTSATDGGEGGTEGTPPDRAFDAADGASSNARSRCRKYCCVWRGSCFALKITPITKLRISADTPHEEGRICLEGWTRKWLPLEL
jgi:hypothetical protein